MIKKYFPILLIVLLTAFVSGKDKNIDRAYYHYYKGKVANQKGNNKKATRNFNKALEIEPENHQYLMALLKVYFETEEFDKLNNSVGKYQKDFESEEEKFIFDFILGTAYACGGDHKNASRSFKKAEKLVDKVQHKDSIIISHLLNNLGCEKILFQPIEYTPHIDEAPHFSISFSVFPEAANYFQRALQYNPSNTTARENLNFSKQYCDKYSFIEDSVRIVKESNRCKVDDLIQKNQHTSIGVNRPQYKLKYLPPKMDMVISELNEYEEVVLLLDNSGSMEDEITIRNVQGTRFNIVIDLAKYLTSTLKSNIQIGAVSVGADCDTYPELYSSTGEFSREKLVTKINTLKVGGYTPLNAALSGAHHLFSDTATSKAILLCTDGINSCGDGNTCDIAAGLYEKGVNIFILSFLLESYNQEEYSVFDCIANISGGQIYEIETIKGVTNKTTDIEMPYYSLKLPISSIDSSFCTSVPRLKCPVSAKISW